MKRKINCLVCDVTYADNNSNNPNDAIYLGFAEGRKNLIDKPVFIHQQSSCIVKARKKDVLDKSGKFVYCIVCGHRINPSEKILSGGGIIKQNGYLVDTNAWIHRPLPLHNYHPMKKKYEDFVISSCYEKAFGHSNFPPDDILSKRGQIIDKYVNRITKPTIIKKEEEEVLKSIIKEGEDKNNLYINNIAEITEEHKAEKIEKKEEKNIFFNLILTGILLLVSYASIYFEGLDYFLYPGLPSGFATVIIVSFVAIKIFEGSPYIPFFKKNFIAILIASVILTNFTILFSDTYNPCNINAATCE